jgi:hypothetical protein
VIGARLPAGFILLLLAMAAPACGWATTPNPSRSPSPAATPSPYFDSAPRVLVANYSPGIGGMMACSSTSLVFTDGPLHTLYTTGLGSFQPRRLMTVAGTIGPINMSGTWAAFAVYAQADDQLSPLAAWTVYGVETISGRSVKLATGSDPTELSELPYPTAGDGFIAWDELMSGGQKVLWRFDESSGAKSEIKLPAGAYPVRPSASGMSVLFVDNSRDPNHAAEEWINRQGEPILLDVRSGQLTHLSPGAVVGNPVLTPSRAVWITSTTDDKWDIQEVSIPGGAVHTLVEIDGASPLWANDHITIWLGGTRGAVTARLGARTAVVSPDNTESPGGMALCGSDLYYAGPDLSLRVAHVG